MSKTLFSYAKSHCANWGNHNGCYLHEVIEWNPPKAGAGRCVLLDDEPCDYFRACVVKVAPVPIQQEYMEIDKKLSVVKKTS